MLWFQVNERLEVVAISERAPKDCRGWINRNDISAYQGGAYMLAQQIADSASKLMGVPYLATDAGDCVSPRYDVIKAPQVGDEVSRSFNGDYYPCGRIVAIQKNYRRIVVDGSARGRLIFCRRRESGTWINKGMWSLLPGVIDKLNPEF